MSVPQSPAGACKRWLVLFVPGILIYLPVQNWKSDILASAGCRLPVLALCLLLGNLAALFTSLSLLPAVSLQLAALVLPLLIRPITRPLAALLAGAALTCVQLQDMQASRLDQSLGGRDVEVVGRISSLVREHPGRVSFMFDYRGENEAIPGTIRLTWFRPPTPPGAGQNWRFSVRLRAPRGNVNPGGFDYERWLFRHGVGATGYVRRAQQLHGESGALRWRFLETRDDIRRWLETRLPQGPVRGLVLALTIGSRDQLGFADRRVLAATGTAHLVAISGLHVGMVAGAVFFLARLGCGWIVHLSWIRRQLCCWSLALPAALAYAGLAGFGLPTRRALIMLAVVACWHCLRWPRRAAAPLALALVLVLVFDPLSPLGWDFWLSFGAVSCIGVLLAGRNLAACPDRARWWRLQWGISIALAPLLASGFGQVSVVSPLVNALLVPWFGLTVMPPLLVSLVCWPWWPGLANTLVAVEAWQLEYIWAGLELLSNAGAASLGGRDELALVVALLGGVLLVGPAGMPGRRLGLVLWLPVIFPLRPALPEGGMQLVVLDVGQGLSAVVHTRRHTMIFDTGPAYPGGDAGRDVVIPYLASRGSGVDLLLVSHGDLDHAGGRESIAREFRPRRELAGDDLDGSYPCEKGQNWSWDGVQFTILYPLSKSAGQGNAASCVLLVRGKFGSVLLPGDIGVAEERILLRYWHCLEVDVVVAPHHGSRSSSGYELVSATRPEWIIYSAGYRNRWNFPSPDVEARWRAVGARALVTGETGAITMTFSGPPGVPPRLQRMEDVAVWRAPAVSRDINVQYHARYSSRVRETSPCLKSSDLADG